MGILDDAIREHLDLKRKHGAPEEDLQRQEEEALGPARRQMAGPADSSESAADQASAATALDEAAVRQDDGAAIAEPAQPIDLDASSDPGPFDAQAPTDPGAPGAETEVIPAAAGAPEGEHEPAPAADEPPIAEPLTSAPRAADVDEPVPDAPEVAEDGFAALGAGEREHLDDGAEAHVPPAEESEDEPEAGERGGEGDDDVLEDTPDFLQETPEHDRLWFEQKPPRDFDFE